LCERRCGLPARSAAVTGLSLLATNRTFHVGLKQAAQSLPVRQAGLAGSQAWPMPVRSFTLVTIANEKSCRALFSDEITLTATLMLVASLGTTKQQRKIHTMQTFNKKDNNC
jgi:hypothetical protein